MRIAIGGISHESNTFAQQPTGLDAFHGQKDRGDAILERWRDTHHELAGFIQGAAEAGFEPVPTLTAGATPAGTVTAEAFETLTAELVARLEAAGPVDGMLLAVHGAMVSEEYPDADGEIIRRVREALGDLPLVVTLDFHTNLSEKMVAHSDAILVYQTNPHVDQRPRGLKAARLIPRIVRKEVRPSQALAKPPMIWNILHQNTSADPLRLFMAGDAARLEEDPGILAASVAAGYPYADVEEMGPAVLVVTDGDPERARREADRLAERLWAARERIEIDLPAPAEAVSWAIRSNRPPVVIVEMGDNIGGGSPGDSTAILAELVRQGAEGAVSVIYDPEAAQACAAAGIGAEVRLEVGGKTDRMHGDPVPITGRVRTLHDGRFFEPEPRHGGQTRWDQGLTAVVELPTGSLVVLNSRRTSPNSIHQLTSLGILPERQRIMVVKGAIAYRAAYEPYAGEIIEADTPGVTAVNPLRFTYRNVRRPLWPLDPAGP